MGLADYYGRAAVAASQVVAGFDSDVLRRTLEQTPVGVAFGEDATRSQEGRSLLDLTVRLLARLYPAMSILPGPGCDAEADRLAELACGINPLLELDTASPSVGISIGEVTSSVLDAPVFAGSEGWDAFVSRSDPQRVGATHNPLGAGAAACMAAGELFNSVVLGSQPSGPVRFSTFSRAAGSTDSDVPNDGWVLAEEATLVGVGAVGNAVAWALSRSPLRGRLHLVDQETVDLSNVQRYVLSARADVGAVKVELASHAFSNDVTAVAWRKTWAEYLASGGEHRYVLAALDSAADRRAVQSALPRGVMNAWTQPGDLGVSVHSEFGDEGACLYCLYRPGGAVPNEDEVVAHALGVSGLVRDVRTLLHNGQGIGEAFLGAVAEGLGRPLDALLPFVGRPVRDLYVEGICGGAVLPLGSTGGARQDVHVPLAHQSALAGVLLAAALARRCISGDVLVTQVTRVDVLGVVSEFATQPAKSDPTSGCICRDQDYVNVYRNKYQGP